MQKGRYLLNQPQAEYDGLKCIVKSFDTDVENDVIVEVDDTGKIYHVSKICLICPVTAIFFFE